MGKCCDRLHLNGVPLLQGPVQQTRTVNNLPADFFVVCVADIQGLGGERVGLDFEVGVGDMVGE